MNMQHRNVGCCACEIFRERKINKINMASNCKTHYLNFTIFEYIDHRVYIVSYIYIYITVYTEL